MKDGGGGGHAERERERERDQRIHGRGKDERSRVLGLFLPPKLHHAEAFKPLKRRVRPSEVQTSGLSAPRAPNLRVSSPVCWHMAGV